MIPRWFKNALGGGTEPHRFWNLTQPGFRTGALVVMIIAAYVVPRAAVLHGIRTSDWIHFDDMLAHQRNLDKVVKLSLLEDESGTQDYLQRFPDKRALYNPVRWPSAIYHLASQWSTWFGPLSIWTPLLTNLGFTLVLLFGVIGLGKAMGSTRVGLWAALLTVLCPPLVASTWYFSTDFATVAMTTMALWLLVAVRGFSRWRRSIALGGWCALGLLIKPTFALYLAVPMTLAVIDDIRSPERRSAGLGWLLTLASMTALVLLLQDIDITAVLEEARGHFASTEKPAAFIVPGSLVWFAFVPLCLGVSAPFPLLLLALPGLILLHQRWRARKGWLVLGFLWGTYLVLTLMPNKLDRYTHSLYPILCLVTVWSIVELLPRRWQTVVLLWVATFFVATLYLVHVRPTPWWLDPNLGSEVNLFELRMPSKMRLDQLRRFGGGRGCEASRLMDQVGALARQEGALHPVAVGYYGENRIGFDDSPGDVELLALQAIRHRLVFRVDLRFLPNNPCIEAFQICRPRELPPTVIIVHPAGVEPLDLQPSLRLATRRKVVCGETTYAVSLMHPGWL